ncbi:MAG: hypothetical protein JXA73_08570, partial [Acidobacteria bacterium]|nr:hypothetical protein [Acidobacteriota bacterium]
KPALSKYPRRKSEKISEKLGYTPLPKGHTDTQTHPLGGRNHGIRKHGIAPGDHRHWKRDGTAH